MDKARQVTDHVGGVDKENNAMPNGGNATTKAPAAKPKPGEPNHRPRRAAAPPRHR